MIAENSSKKELLIYIAELEGIVQSMASVIDSLRSEIKCLNNDIDDLVSHGGETPSMSYKY